MKNTIVILMVTLAATIVFGLILRGDLESSIRTYHRFMALLTTLLGIYVAVAAFITKNSAKTKGFLTLTLLLIISAAMGGRNAALAINYDFSYLQMIGSAALALITSYLALREVEN